MTNKEKLIDLLKTQEFVLKALGHTQIADGVNHAIDMVNDFDDWEKIVDCEDSLPEADSTVLALANGRIRVLTYEVVRHDDDYSHWWNDEDGEFCYYIDSGDVTHWMPLPQPPKETQ
ncbi:DUF551 domain-containing protein [Moraxella pluranimalium]|uniref:DUF551 domain-containing protein n=1 Tax=Moraxella pluranimalium TaxID=470453 RepID=A0A1T0CQP3_9GAMM|nr:DUF551 domain-containing protein [Moraxella pluranimalium]OOS24662.1 hypothetical protein B0680_04340 [Moraxella pluranimalium]